MWIEIIKYQDLLIAEAKVAYLAADLGIKYVISEGDALNVIQQLQSSLSPPHWSIKNTIS